MKRWRLIFIVFFFLGIIASFSYGASQKSSDTLDKKRILVVSSYHKEHSWTQKTNRGFCEAMLKFGYFDHKDQISEYSNNDYIETSKVIIKKLWMDAKRRSSKAEKDGMSVKVYRIAKEFNPHLILLGDDDATEHIGRKFLDTSVPIVFWGLNNTPIKYGLVDSIDKPGHNVTGIYQSGYYLESLELLKTLVPHIKTFAVLSDSTPTGRSHYKQIEYLARKGHLPFKLVETVSTNDYATWKRKALELQRKVDAFFVAQYSGLRDEMDNYIKPGEVANWYITHIRVPETSRGHFVDHGMLCSCDDSGYNQGYEAVVIAHDILAKGMNPATYIPRTPKRGPFKINTQRAKMLGIALTKDIEIEEYIEKASALVYNK